MRKWFYSDVLGISLRVWVSMHARRCIMKRGSFDNYLLNTKPKQIDSRFGLYIRGLMKDKMQNPETFVMPIIPGQAAVRKRFSSRWWSYRSRTPIYMPAHIKANEDMSKYYIKTPDQMSRYELAELEKELRELEDPTNTQAQFELAEGEEIPQWIEENEQFKEYKRQLRLLVPIRHATIKRYFDKFKYRKAAR